VTATPNKHKQYAPGGAGRANARRCCGRYVGFCFWALNFKKVGFSVVGNPALSISCNSYVGAFVPGAFVGHLDKNRCGAFFVVCH
jgi:hypothetical protein